MMRPHILFIGIALGTGVLSSAVGYAAVPSEVSIQGVLRDSQGQLQSMPVNIKIEFFNAESNGMSIAGPYTTNAVVVTNGLFTVQVSDATLANRFGTAASVWVEVTVNSTDVFPRQKVTSEAFALRAAVAETLACSGCVTDPMIAGVAAAKVSGKVASATAADTAAGLTCTGCVTNVMIVGVDGAKVTGTVGSATNATQLGGVAASSYLQTTSPLNGANLSNGSVGAAKITSGALAHGHTATLNVVAGTQGDVAVSAGGVGVVCGNCPAGTIVVSGTCTSSGLGAVSINDSFIDLGSNRWCCRMVNTGAVQHTISVTPNCASITVNTTSVP